MFNIFIPARCALRSPCVPFACVPFGTFEYGGWRGRVKNGATLRRQESRVRLRFLHRVFVSSVRLRCDAIRWSFGVGPKMARHLVLRHRAAGQNRLRDSTSVDEPLVCEARGKSSLEIRYKNVKIWLKKKKNGVLNVTICVMVQNLKFFFSIYHKYNTMHGILKSLILYMVLYGRIVKHFLFVASNDVYNSFTII